MSQKRTLDAFFSAAPKRHKAAAAADADLTEPPPPPPHHHPQYPFPIARLPAALRDAVSSPPPRPGRRIDDQPDLDLLYFEPFIPRPLARTLFAFLRAELPFYRVEYDIKRRGVQTHVRTPRADIWRERDVGDAGRAERDRWTTVFGVDDTSCFNDAGLVVAKAVQAGARQPGRRYTRYAPRPIPACLDGLRRATEAATACSFNICLVNYYASGADSISLHSDDERFLGPRPAIVSFSLGARRDFVLKHKPPSGYHASAPLASADAVAKPLKMSLGSGDMVLIRGDTQAKWLHSVPKRSGRAHEDGGRINITFRRAIVEEGTDNYYNYNVGRGPVYRWHEGSRQMILWEP